MLPMKVAKLAASGVRGLIAKTTGGVGLIAHLDSQVLALLVWDGWVILPLVVDTEDDA
jgi:hypothetical protein